MKTKISYFVLGIVSCVLVAAGSDLIITKGIQTENLVANYIVVKGDNGSSSLSNRALILHEGDVTFAFIIIGDTLKLCDGNGDILQEWK